MAKPRKFRRDKGEKSEFTEQVLKIDRVNRVVKGGRRLRFRATVVIGNRQGKVGVATGKADEVAEAVKKAVNKAKRNLIQVQVFNGTIAHQIRAKFKSSRVLLMPAPEGTGVIAGNAIRTIAELTGIKNLLSKSYGSRNKFNTAQATIVALQGLKLLKKEGGEEQKPLPKNDSVKTKYIHKPKSTTLDHQVKSSPPNTTSIKPQK